MAIKPLSERRGMLLYSAAAHSQLLTNSSLVVRHSNDASNDAKILATSIRLKSPKKVAAIYVQNEWGEFYNSRLAESLNHDGAIAFESAAYLPSDTDFRDRLLPLIGHQPDIFVVSSFGAAAGTIIKQLRQLGFHGAIFANNGFVLSRDTLTVLGEAPVLELYFQDYPELPIPFCEAYLARYGKKPSYLALAGYTDIELLASAAAKVGSSAEAIAKYIRELKHFRGKYESVDISGDGDITLGTVVREWNSAEYNNRIHPTCRAFAQQAGDS
jgi:ABC-type branched-subunit amino acid transport system substrate-binding protein